MRSDRRRSDTVLSCAGLSDNPRLPHFYGEQTLPNGVIDFVRTSVQQILPLQINPWPAKMRGQPRGELQGRRTPSEILEQTLELRLESGIRLSNLISPLKLEQRHHKRFRNIASAIRAEAPSNRSRIDNL